MNLQKSSFAILTVLAGLAQPLAAQTPTAATGNPYEIRSIKRTVKRIAHVDGGWKNQAPCIEADLRITRELGDTKPYAKAYFYDKDGALLVKFDSPPQSSDDHSNYATLPAVFKMRQANEVAFPVSAKAEQTGKKWNRVVIVFGDATYASAEVYPKDDIVKFEFPEKERVKESSKAAAR